MHPTPSHLPETNRAAITTALNGVLADAIDLHAQVKTAHWNVRGPYFAPYHELFDKAAGALAAGVDEVAERIATLGAHARGTVRRAAESSRIAELPEVSRDRDLVRLLSDRYDRFLSGVREARRAADQHADPDTSDLLTGLASETEKYAWMLRASAAE